MPRKHKTRHSHGWLAWYIPLLLVEFAVLITLLIHGKNIAILNPQGMVAHEQVKLLRFTIVLLLAIAVPVLTLLYFTAWKYRESNTKAVHEPDASRGKFFVASMWIFPTMIMLVLTTVLYPATHRLQPNKKIAADAKPLTIQVVSMRWKWVFIYPEQKIATVNFVQIPVNTPVTFELTADEAPMSSFWIPNLGGQLYSMTSHVNQLNLLAETAGDYPGSSAELNGAGFSGMKFTARASSASDFDQWIQGVHQLNNVLDTATYDNLLKPSESNPTAFYSDYQSDLYSRVLEKYAGSHEGHTTNTSQEGH